MEKYTIDISDDVISDLEKRLSETRWPDQINDSGWNYGTDKAYLQELCDYWENYFDWTKQQNHLNMFSHYKTTVDGFELHFIYQKSSAPNAVPLLLTHGFPDSFVRFLKLIPLLNERDENGLAFDLIIPSIPGYGFSEIPSVPGINPKKIAQLFDGLMIQLGYFNYFAHGGDWGSSITEQLAFLFPDHLYGIHLTDLPYHHLFSVPEGELTAAEKKYLEAGKQWSTTEGAYAMIQSTKPQTLAYGLNDSPAGLASWIVEKFQRWSDNHGDIENSFSKDELLTNLTIYWGTQTINSAIRIYYESMRFPPENGNDKTEVPTGVALFPKDLILAPREFADRFYKVVQWSEMPKGGHFAAMEEPELLAADIRSFVAKVVNAANA